MSTTKEQFLRMVDWYRLHKPGLTTVTVAMTLEEMDEHFDKRDGKHFYYEFEVVRR